MKNTKKIIATLLSLILLVSISTTTFAKTYTGKNWYKQVLNSQSGMYRVKTINPYGKEVGYKTKKRSSYKYYKVVDINVAAEEKSGNYVVGFEDSPEHCDFLIKYRNSITLHEKR